MKNENQVQNEDVKNKVDEKLKHEFSEAKFWSCLEDQEIIDEACINNFHERQIFVSGIYNSSTTETATGFVHVDYKLEKNHFELIEYGYFYPLFDSIESLEANDITGELEAIVYAIFYCSRNGINDVVIFYNYDETLQWLSGQLLSDVEHLSDLRELIIEDIERSNLLFSKISSPSQINYCGIANKLAKKAIILENHFN